jgi:hypothetical protein
LKVHPIDRLARAAVANLLEGSPTFARLYNALNNADANRVSLTIHAARAPNEFETLARNAQRSGMNSAYTGRTPNSPDGRIVYNPEGSQSNVETWLGHEIVHAAGIYADVVGAETEVPGGCGQHSRFTPASCGQLEDDIHREMVAWRARQDSARKPAKQ